MVSALSFGGGVNSTSMLVGLVERKTPPDVVLFSDTGGERPETYEHVRAMEQWCIQRSILWQTVSNAGRGQGDTLEQNCLQRQELPSLAYGFKGCSVKWKRQPMDRWVAKWDLAIAAWERGEKVVRYIGIDAGETHRAVLTEDAKFAYQYPLVHWGWDRDACVLAIKMAGLAVPPKSSCFFCPAMRKHEILELQRTHPDLLQRALAIESNAKTHTVVGLGREWKWSNFVKQENAQGKLFQDAITPPCGCMDESEDDA